MVSSKTKNPAGGMVVMIDGLDGVGKTTQIERINKQLSDCGLLVKTSRVIGGAQIGEDLRQVILSGVPRPGETDLYIAMAMYSALAVQIDEWRTQDAVVLIDRSPLCLMAYQHYAEGVELELVEYCLSRALRSLNPDLIVIYDLDTAAALERDSHKNSDYFTSHDRSFFDNVRAGYLQTAKKYPQLVRLIDIKDKTEAEITDQTMKLLDL